MTTAITHVQPLVTGVESLDDHLGGGLSPGTIVAFLADPTSQSEILLAALASQRPTLYLTLRRSAESVRRSLSRSEYGIDASVREFSPGDPFEWASRHLDRVEEPTTVILDPANELEDRESDRLVSFLDQSGDRLLESGSLLVLHCLRRDAPLPGRETTTYMADVVFDLETDHSGELIENYLVVPKIRGGRPIPHPVKLHLSDEVRVDTSRDIA